MKSTFANRTDKPSRNKLRRDREKNWFRNMMREANIRAMGQIPFDLFLSPEDIIRDQQAK